MAPTIRREILDAVRRFDIGAVLEGHVIRLTGGATLPNNQRALQWIVATYRARTRTPREAALTDPQLGVALERVEAAFGPVQVLEISPREPPGGGAR